jgi:quercetin dioxygenase-like cupin family protein
VPFGLRATSVPALVSDQQFRNLSTGGYVAASKILSPFKFRPSTALNLHRSVHGLALRRQSYQVVRGEERFMRRGSLVTAFIVLVVAAGVGGTLYPAARAQDATPASEGTAANSNSGTFRALASGSMDLLAPGTTELGFGRVTLDPGASVPFDPTDPSAILVYIASGAATFRVDAEMTVARAGGAGTPMPTEPEAVAPDTEFILREGDSALFPPAIAGEARNDGTEEAVAWVVTVVHRTMAAATPTP